MTLKSIIDVDVNSAQFSRFNDLFTRYTEALAKTPAVWKQASNQQNAMVAGFQRMTAAMMAQRQIMDETTAATVGHVSLLSKAEGLWSSMWRFSGSLLGNVLRIGEGLLKWTGVLGLLGGGLGIWGFDRMMNAGTRDRRAAAGLGMNVGGLRAFGLDFGRMIDTEGYLGWLNQAEIDVTKQGPAYALLGRGLSGNTQNDALSMLNAARGLAQRTPTGLLGPMFGAYGLPFSAEDIRRLQSTKPGEYQELVNKYGKDAGALNIQDRALKGLTDLSNQIDRAGFEINKTFVEGLEPLYKPLGNLSQSMADAVKEFMKSNLVGEAITKLGGWINEFSGWLERFDKKIPGYMKDLNDLFDVLHMIAHPIDTAEAGLKSIWDRLQGGASTVLGNVENKAFEWYVSARAQGAGLPKGLAETILALEHSGSGDVSPKGAAGIAQLMPLIQKKYGVVDPTNPYQSVTGEISFLSDLQKKYKGDLAKVIAAYHSGEPAVDRAVASMGANWMRSPEFGPESQQYMAHAPAFMHAFGGTLKLDLNVTTQPGTNVTVTAAGLAR